MEAFHREMAVREDRGKFEGKSVEILILLLFFNSFERKDSLSIFPCKFLSTFLERFCS